MKKIITLSLLVFGVFISYNSAEACSMLAGQFRPTVEDVANGGVVTLGQALSDGDVVVAKKVMANDDSAPRYFILEAPGHSCSERLNDFEKGEYVVSVSSEPMYIVDNNMTDDNFAFYFDSKTEAEEKYNELLEKETVLPQPGSYQPVGYTLRRGMQGSAVLALQTALNGVLNSNLILDGDYGQGTAAAVLNFQRNNGLSADGIAGVKTQALLAHLSGSQDPPTIGLDELGRIISPSCKVISLCNGPIKCVNASLDTSGLAGNCMYKESYACYKNAGNICEPQSNGDCGWTETDDLKMCIAEKDA